jgi:nucleolar protein 56
LRYFLVVSELGLILVDDKEAKVISKFDFSKPEERTRQFLSASSGELSEEQITWLKSQVTANDLLLAEPQLFHSLTTSGFKPEAQSQDQLSELSKKKVDLMVSAGLVKSPEEAQEAIRNTSMEISSLRIKELSAMPDLQAMESVQALDEIDKAANMVSSRVREWYGLHFPELVSMIDDNPSLIKLILNFRTRQNYDENELEQMGYSKNKSRAIAIASKESKGADVRDEDLSRIVLLAEEAQHLFSVRDKLASHVEKTMRQVAPNVSEIAGATIGARLIARAGGLEKLAMLPASTIQILGAEKALYRALKSGARPPKHGILFQHAAVHSAPKWQRGKIARSIAGKIAIAARIDQYRGTRESSVEESLASRLNEIKIKYKDAPKEKPQFVPRKFLDKRGEPKEFERRRSYGVEKGRISERYRERRGKERRKKERFQRKES